MFVSEPVTIWSLSGFRDNRYHAVHRDFDEKSPAADSVNELGKQLLKVAGLEGFDDSNGTGTMPTSTAATDSSSGSPAGGSGTFQ